MSNCIRAHPLSTTFALRSDKFVPSDLDSTYGHVKSLRIPRKADNSSRGFAFVHYSSAKEAQAALEGLRDTHVLGRHLIVETTK